MLNLVLEHIQKFKIGLEEAKDDIKQVQSINCVSIKSLRHPDAPTRLCHPKSATHPFLHAKHVRL